MGVHRAARIGLVAGMLVSCLSSSPAQAAGTTSNGRIAFGHRFPSGNVEIVTVLPDGTGMKRLSERHAVDTSPSYSANGAYIVFASDVSGSWQVWEMRANGSHKKPVTHMRVSATSPDLGPQGHGHTVVFAGDAGLGTADDLYRINSGGYSLFRLTHGSAADEFPAWSPNGRRIAFVSDRSGAPQVWTVSGWGQGLRRLTNDPNGVTEGPDWSPDGSRIVFAAGPAGAEDIWVMNADGSNPVQLTTDAAADFAPAWSPDGTQIAFVSRRVPGSQNVFVMNSDGSGQHAITPPGSMDFAPAWQSK
jgi:Tol biopolymer transport system component